MVSLKKCFQFLGLVLALWVFPQTASAKNKLSDIDCVIEPHMTVELSSPVSGILEVVNVKRGDRVKKGQVLARLKSGVEEASLKLAKARADSLTDKKSQKVRYELSKRKLARIEKLYRKNMVPKSDQDEAETEKIVAELEVLRAEENHQLALLDMNRAKEILKLRSIVSPIDGVVVERFKSPGEYVEEQPIMKLAQIDPLNVEVIVPLSWLGSIKPGMPALIRPERPVRRTFKARVAIVDPVVDASSGTIGIRLELPNPKFRLSAGLKCSIRFPTRK
ncbi:MAG: efflux RND transporter periplasmic adaptor subunit [Nitrospinaceae bacterium]|nr:efflux RND transporter periplasmic adaptor subunit [Nitrospinaceae bacterium]NIR56557.1 efflux RND transporter periplasmic adaptor subunit [Nitrospinaceae bacterium]NIS87016.1 efflux RND transporter periplasmic adaptor subunit [Nitrospinaceae bacterium]NIT83858.1 efflux RND transporter periplasmic adaptor subunit [Nitrospinaceae bacterium]NIU46066.1 efflux RND transporter periplasmic adaptor subunit [Nitrospinaceae bacterium]